MSIYATLWDLRFPRDGHAHDDSDWVTVRAQGVPSHIGTPTPGQGYETGDPYAAFLPPSIPYDPDGVRMRAVVFVLSGASKGTERSGQEYPSPLLVMTGADYDAIPFQRLHDQICDALRKVAGVIVEKVIPLQDGKTFTIYTNGDARNSSGGA